MTATGRVLEEGLIETGRVIDKGITSIRQGSSDVFSPQMVTPDGSIFRKTVENNHAVENFFRSQIEDFKRIVSKGDIKHKELLSSNGSFIDPKLKSDYAKYITRKSKEGKLPKDRLEWIKARDYWLNDSPMARGNEYNRTIRNRDMYDYHEIHLENGKRLDSFDSFTKEIISRKATDLDMIDEKTYRAYLKEMNQKYSPGTRIRSNAYPELDGKLFRRKTNTGNSSYK